MSDKPIHDSGTLSAKSPRHAALKIALVYAGISVLWILFSDQLLSVLFHDVETITRVQMVKGWGFVIVTGCLIYILLRREIKKYRLIDAQLRHSRVQLQYLLDSLPIAISWADAQRNIQYCNYRFQQLFGYTTKDIPTVDKWFKLAFPDPEYRRVVAASSRAALEKAQHSRPDTEPTEVIVTSKDGSKHYVEVVGTFLDDRILVVFNDITEKRRLDRQLRLMQRWVEQSVDFFFWIGEDSRVLYVNLAVCNALGYSKKELHSMRVSEFDMDLPLDAWPDFARKVKAQHTYSFETRLRRKDGRIIPVEINANSLRFEGKVHFFAYGKDISAKVEAEKKQNELEKQLRQTQKMEAIGTLAGGIAHDFNNILSAVIGYTELLEMGLPENSAECNYARQVKQAGNRARDLVQQILTFSRQAEQELRPVEVGKIVREVVKLMRSSLPTTIEIKVNLQGDSLVMGDPTQLHQILMNLCANAGHAMEEKGGLLTIELKSIELKEDLMSKRISLKPGVYVRLSVSDTGYGIPAEHLDRVFDPFFTTKKRGEGTGMGLSVVHGIIESYQGAIYVYSEEGDGAVFKIFLPSIERRAQPDTRRAKDVPKGTERILFVDDEPALVRLGETQLTGLGYDVSARSNCIDALALFKTKPDHFDLVITDMTMPDMTGDAFAREIRRIRPEIPVILCTGFSTRISEENAGTLPFNALLMKPIIFRDMAQTVRNVLDEKPSTI